MAATAKAGAEGAVGYSWDYRSSNVQLAGLDGGQYDIFPRRGFPFAWIVVQHLGSG